MITRPIEENIAFGLKPENIDFDLLVKSAKVAHIYSFIKNTEKGLVCWITFLSTLLFPILSIELFSGINTHIWTGIIFGFLMSLMIEKTKTSS